MKAVILEETRKIVVRDVPDAEMRATTDALLRLTSSAICGTDLHFYEGRMRGLEGQIIRHEPLGIAEEVGAAVRNVKKVIASSFPPTSAAASAPCARRDIRRRVSPPTPDRQVRPRDTRTRAATRVRRRNCFVCRSPMPTA